jgi:DNA polymerase I-like protein with 3'-5' exonuclease and polymerase domains
MAHLSGDAGLLAAFTATGMCTARPPPKWRSRTADANQRAAKAINFGLMYGMSPWAWRASSASIAAKRRPT